MSQNIHKIKGQPYNMKYKIILSPFIHTRAGETTINDHTGTLFLKMAMFRETTWPSEHKYM